MKEQQKLKERPEKFIAVGEPSSAVRRVIAARSVKKIEPFLRKELPKYHDDEEVDLDEFENIEAEIEEDESAGVNQMVKKKSLKECLHGQMISKVDHQRSKVKN